jgi:hypothetical protein
MGFTVEYSYTCKFLLLDFLSVLVLILRAHKYKFRVLRKRKLENDAENTEELTIYSLRPVLRGLPSRGR